MQGGLACADGGTVNNWEAKSSGALSSVTSSMLAGSGNWPLPSCPVQEAFDSWPANFTPVGYDVASDASANFTAPDGTSGQPYLMLGTAPLTTATQAGRTTLALAPSIGGLVPAMSTAAGANPAAPGVAQASAGAGVNTANGDLTQMSTDFDIPTYGPPLNFTRIYDAQAVQAQTRTLTPGVMGYGWIDNWATSVSTSGMPVSGDMYTISGLGTDNGNGGAPTGVPLNSPGPVWFHGNV